MFVDNRRTVKSHGMPPEILIGIQARKTFDPLDLPLGFSRQGQLNLNNAFRMGQIDRRIETGIVPAPRILPMTFHRRYDEIAVKLRGILKYFLQRNRLIPRVQKGFRFFESGIVRAA